MEVLNDFNGLTTSSTKDMPPRHAATQEYLVFSTAINYLKSLGFEISFTLLKRYLDEKKLNTYAWLASGYNHGYNSMDVYPALDSELDRHITSNDELTLMVEPCFIKASTYRFCFIEELKSPIEKNGIGIDIVVEIMVAESIVSAPDIGFSSLSKWVPYEHIFKLPFLKVSELNDLAKNAMQTVQEIEDIRSSVITTSQNDLSERLKQLEKENELLKQQLGNAPSNSTFLAVGALVELLTEQKTPRRTQSRIKDELEDKALKGLSRGSLNDIFAAANKALKASKDAG